MSDYKPVVGEECEYMPKGYTGWLRMTPTYVSDQIVCWIESNSGNELTEYRELLSFRSIRTQEEIEREEAIEKLMICLFRGKGYCLSKETELEICNAVLGKGYRLVGEKVDAEQMRRDLSGAITTIPRLLANYDIYRKVVK